MKRTDRLFSILDMITGVTVRAAAGVFCVCMALLLIVTTIKVIYEAVG